MLLSLRPVAQPPAVRCLQHRRTPARSLGFPSDRSRVKAHAKSKGGKGGKQQKTSALDKLLKAKETAATNVESTGDSVEATSDQYSSPEVMMLLLVLTNSYWQTTKEYLMEDVDFDQLAAELFRAPFGLLVHDKHDNKDPVFTYANQAALQMLETTWADLVGSSSAQCTAEGKDSFLSPSSQQVASANTCETWLKSPSGKPLKIKDALIFDVSNIGGELLGQAVKFSTVEKEDGELVILDPATAAALEKLRVPSEEEVAAAQAAVEEQGAFVRNLKEGQGLNNQDAEVIAAVAELKSRKERLQEMQEKRAAAAAAPAAAE